MLYSNNLLPIITKLTDHTATLIDHIYTNTHIPVFCLTDIAINKQNNKTYYRDYSTFDQTQYLNDIIKINWPQNINNNKHINDITKETVNAINNIINKHEACFQKQV